MSKQYDLKTIINKFVPSTQMQKYLLTQELSDEDVFNLIVGSPVDFSKKLEVIQKGFKSIYPEMCKEYEQAYNYWIADLKNDEIISIEEVWYDLDVYEEQRAGLRLFSSPTSALNYIREICKEEQAPEQKYNYGWFEINKWKIDRDNAYKNTYTYYAANDEIWFFSNKQTDRSSQQIFSNSTNLNLPIPFNKGDIIDIDCWPFAYKKRAIIIDDINNKDCCGVWIAYINEHGKLDDCALKHSGMFEGLYGCRLSPLYKLKLSQEGHEDIFDEIREDVLNGNFDKSLDKYNR